MNKLETVSDVLAYFEEIVENVHELTNETAGDILQIARNRLYEEKIKISSGSDIKRVDEMRESQKSDSSVVANFKMTLSANKLYSDFARPLMRAANGLIMQVFQRAEGGAVECRVLSVPSNNLTQKIDKREIQRHLDKNRYDVFEVKDGTTLRLYHDEFRAGDLKWTIATRNMPDIEHVEWRGELYSEVISEVLQLYPEFSYDKLDPAKTYVIGVKHPKHHPFGQSGERKVVEAWRIGSAEDDDNDIGIPWQQRITLEGFEIADVGVSGNLQAVLYHCMHALTNYGKGQAYPFLGVILRSKNEEKTREFSDVLIESSLWRSIKKSIYQNKAAKSSEEQARRNEDFKNIEFLIIESYLDITRRAEFISLFPVYREYYDKLSALVKVVAAQLVKPTIPSAVKAGLEFISDDAVQFLVEDLDGVVKKKFKPSGKKNREKDVEVVLGIISNPDYANIFFDAMASE
jgi:hypothetical protein